MKKNVNCELEKTKRKKVFVISFIVILISIVIVSASFIAYAWAKYSSGQSGEASADVAKWYFIVTGGSEQSADNINFALTRTDSNRCS